MPNYHNQEQILKCACQNLPMPTEVIFEVGTLESKDQGWRHDSSGTALDYQTQGSEFNPSITNRKDEQVSFILSPNHLKGSVHLR
jgi:hypothetical protein